MKRRNFSPGPWNIFNLPEASRIQIETTTHYVVCEVATFTRQRAPRFNAQLIKEAPEMYYILEMIASQISPEHFGRTIYARINAVIENVNSIV